MRLAASLHPRRSRFAVIAGVVAFLGVASVSPAGLKVYYLRHAEGGHQVRKEFENVPKEQWPDYVGNGAMFTPQGKEQVVAITQELKKYHFDFVAVSPIWRARNTILPYLKENERKAEIWPELTEMSSPATKVKELPPARADLFTGADIVIPAEERPWFFLREGAGREFETEGSQEQKRADVRASFEQAVAMVKKRWGGTEKSVLLVGHANNGRELLISFNPKYRGDARVILDNTRLWMMEEQPDGSFRLLMVNSQPLEDVKPAKAGGS